MAYDYYDKYPMFKNQNPDREMLHRNFGGVMSEDCFGMPGTTKGRTPLTMVERAERRKKRDKVN